MQQINLATLAHDARSDPRRLSASLCGPAIVGGLIFVASLFGILTRPVGFLAAFWPANALLLGIMVRFPSLATPAGWIAATLGYLAADLITGGGLLITLWLTAGNLAGAAVGVAIFQHLSDDDRHLLRPSSALTLFAVCAASGGAAALVGGGAGPVLIGKDWLTSCGFWFVTELVNGILLLPVILTAPPMTELRDAWAAGISRVRTNPRFAAPALTLLLSMLGSLIVGGPGALMFSIPAILWCALTYNLFATAIMTLFYCAWTLIAVSSGAFVIHPIVDYINETMSIRLGISLLALGPLTAASISKAREDVLNNLNHAVNHDFLTDTLARRAFMRQGEDVVGAGLNRRTVSSGDRELVVALLMMDIDHFKSVNDRLGHAAGDQVLVSFAATITRLLRDEDLFGRLGGEEFAVILPRATLDDARIVAERLRSHVAETPISLANGETLHITVSIGLCTTEASSSASLESLLTRADEALYQSKRLGRNRVTSIDEARPLRIPSAHQKQMNLR